MEFFEKLNYLWNELTCYSTEEQIKKFDSAPNEERVNYVVGFQMNEEQLNEIFEAKKLIKIKR